MDKMTAEQALEWLESLHEIAGGNAISQNKWPEAQAAAKAFRQALSAPRVPDGWRVSISKYGLEVSAPDGKITEVIKPKFRWSATDPVVYEFLSGFLLAASPEPVAIAEPYCKDCQYAGILHCSDPVNCSAGAKWIDIPANLRAEVEALKSGLEKLKTDPGAVFTNMSRGYIAKPLFRSLVFLYAEDEGFDFSAAIDDISDAARLREGGDK